MTKIIKEYILLPVNKEVKRDKSIDKNMVKKVLTFKSGQFVFSQKFSYERLNPLLVEAKILYKTVAELPILPGLAAQIKEELIRKSIFGTAALEGNPLTEEEISQIISLPDKDRKNQAEKEIQNLKSVYNFIKIQPFYDETYLLNEDIVKETHSLITKDIEYPHNTPGQYRNHIVKVGDVEHGGVYTPPKCFDDIKLLMKEFIEWINSDEIRALDPVLRAALAHYHLGLIHPFGDGNGRTARIVETILLQFAGIKYVPIMLSNFYYRNIEDYFWVFSKSRRNKEDDVTPFLELVLRGVIDSLDGIREKITFFIRQFTLRDYYAFLMKEKEIIKRQHDFLIMLLDYFKPFTLSDMFNLSPFNVLYRDVSERTARRDLKKLYKKNLLKYPPSSGLLGRSTDIYELHFKALEA
ncbi:MAG: Fic family protein [bacterium]|nr:Fic family protein [bacterium]